MATILIVDDEPLNRELLHAYLDVGEHFLVDADSGAEALALAKRARPDLVLLDVMMPGLSGFETVELLKTEAKNEFLPIILITALNDDASLIRGLRAGADEFLTKPVNRNELMIRVAHLLTLRSKELTLLQRNVELIELQRFRDEMSALIVHDLKNPLAVMMSNVDFVIDDAAVLEPDAKEALHDIKAAGQRALRLLANLLDLTRLEAGRLAPQKSRTPMAALINPIVHERAHLAKGRGIAVDCAIVPEALLYADLELIGRVVENVFDNALRHTPAGGRIAVNAVTARTAVQLKIGNSGSRIPPEERIRIFDKFGQASGSIGRMNLGLGLYFCRLAAEAHGGRIWVEETPELPTVFGLELPC